MLKEQKNKYDNLENYLKEEIRKKDEFIKSFFIESLLYDEKKSEKEYQESLEKIEKLKEDFKDVKNDKYDALWINNGKEEFEIFLEVYTDYIKNKYQL